MTGQCSICGKYDRLDKHHIFNGAFRGKAERMGAYMYICRDCHMIVHNSAQLRLALKKQEQQRLMQKHGWSVDEFRNEFGKSYL